MANFKFETLLGELHAATEMRRRASILSQLPNSEAVFEKTETGYDRYFDEDGAGNEATIIFRADGVNDDSILMFAYDHESKFNYYSRDVSEQIVFDGMPESFKYLLDEDRLKWTWLDETEPKIIYASSAAWLEHGSDVWSANPAFMQQVFDDNSNDDGGFHYMFKSFLKTNFNLASVLEMVQGDHLNLEDYILLGELFKNEEPESIILRNRAVLLSSSKSQWEKSGENIPRNMNIVNSVDDKPDYFLVAKDADEDEITQAQEIGIPIVPISYFDVDEN